ncbi:MAG: tRNA (adenosine(37)-N6)-threonylcarbamoyltransferase complex dimerization subunit type 1 TsaB, partial [Pseudomonadota bacterium]
MSKNKIIVAIETSSIACSAAVLIQSSSAPVIYEVWQQAPRQHTDLILPMLDDVLQQAGCTLSDVDALAFGCGPGAFTGVRIATSVIQAISYAAKIKVVLVSSLAALAQGQFRLQQEHLQQK